MSNKDRDAITAQRISFRDVPIEKIQNIHSHHFFLKDVVSGKGIAQKGDLTGNRFTILIRTERHFTETSQFGFFTKHLKEVKDQGFYNFYYLQRFGQEFGTSRINNYIWALSILKGDYKQAVYDFLVSTSERELSYFKHIRGIIGTHFGEWEYIHNLLSALPLIFATELKIVSYLVDHPTDFIGALHTVDDQIRLWVYSISSFLFNRFISDSTLQGTSVLQKLPLFLSTNPDEWMHYAKTLRAWDVFPPPFKNFQPFRFIELKTRMVSTKESVVFHGADVEPEGIKLTFSLSKGSYATSLLAHIFNLVSGKPLDSMSTNEVIPHDQSRTIDFFRPVIQSKEKDILNF
jgi:tRNA(Glu) U13 pseudouridine synthase TruD